VNQLEMRAEQQGRERTSDLQESVESGARQHRCFDAQQRELQRELQ
jgi:hypothetical protein